MNMMLPVDTAVTVPVNIAPLIDDGDFKTREGSVAYNASGMDLVWNFMTTAGVLTQTAVTPTTSGDYDWSEMGDAMYKIEIPASGGASINNDTEGWGWFSGVITGILPFRGPTIAFVPAHVVNGLVAGSDNLQVDAVQVEGSDATNQIRDAVVDDATRIDASALNTAAAAVGSDGSGLTEAGGTGDHLTALATAAALTTVDTVVDAIKVVTDALTAAAAAKLATSAGTIITGTVSNANTTPTTTVFAADDITEATADHYIGRVIIFTSGALSGQATDITDYALDTSEGKFTVTTMTDAPANDDTFVII